MKNPLDASKFITDPCLTLTQKQIQQFGGSTPGKRDSSVDGVGCMWQVGADSTTAISVNFISGVTDGLANAYKLNAANAYKNGYFNPIEIEGYPAAYNSFVDHRSYGHCDLAVGYSDQSIFSLLIQGDAGKDGCSAAMKVATEVLHTIQGGQ